MLFKVIEAALMGIALLTGALGFFGETRIDGALTPVGKLLFGGFLLSSVAAICLKIYEAREERKKEKDDFFRLNQAYGRLQSAIIQHIVVPHTEFALAFGAPELAAAAMKMKRMILEIDDSGQQQQAITTHLAEWEKCITVPNLLSVYKERPSPLAPILWRTKWAYHFKSLRDTIRGSMKFAGKVLDAREEHELGKMQAFCHSMGKVMVDVDKNPRAVEFFRSHYGDFLLRALKGIKTADAYLIDWAERKDGEYTRPPPVEYAKD